MKHRVAHDLPLELAKKATQKALEAYQAEFQEYNPKVHWNEDHSRAVLSFTAKGVKLSGSLVNTPNAIEIELNVPFLFKIFQNKAISVVEGEINKWIERAKNGELSTSS